MELFKFIIPYIPDCTQFKYFSKAAGKDVRSFIFDCWISVLAMLSSFEPGEVSMTLRGEFSPNVELIQDRLQWSVILKISDDVSEGVVQALLQNGPVGSFYEFIPDDSSAEDKYRYRAVAEILRREKTIKPKLSPEENKAMKYVQLYYEVHLFEAKTENDFLRFDQVLSNFDQHVRFEIRLEPAKVEHVLSTLTDYIYLLMSVNHGVEDFVLPGMEKSSKGRVLDTEYEYSKFRDYKRDPIADDFLRTMEDIHEKFRAPQFNFDMRVFAETEEVATLMAYTIAESAFDKGQYQIISHDEKSPWFNGLVASKKNGSHSKSSHSTKNFKQPPTGRTNILRQLARMASSEELASIFRLPVASTGSPSTMYKSSDPGANFRKKYLQTAGQYNEAKEEGILIGLDMESGASGDDHENQ